MIAVAHPCALNPGTYVQAGPAYRHPYVTFGLNSGPTLWLHPGHARELADTAERLCSSAQNAARVSDALDPLRHVHVSRHSARPLVHFELADRAAAALIHDHARELAAGLRELADHVTPTA